MSLLKKFITATLEFFLPSHCFVCESWVADGKLICEKCYSELERLPKKCCLICGEAKQNCKCANHVFYFSKVCSPFYNNGGAQKGIYELKFSSKTVNASFFALEMAESVQKSFSDIKFDVICSVPAHPIKVLKRGFDQSELLAKDISAQLKVPIAKNVLKRRLLSKTQHKEHNVAARYENAHKSYYAKKKLNNETVLLVDDIKTSGASLSACARCLLYTGAKEVYCVTALNTK